VERALEKLPADRFGTALEFADAVSGKTVLAPTPGSRDGTGTVPAGAARFGLRDVAYTAALAAAIAIAGQQWTRAHRPDQQPVVRFPLVIPYDQHFRDGLNGTPLAISPTGDRIAYITSTSASANPTLWVRGTDQLEGKAIAAPLTIRYPCFSPDGKWVAFTDGFDVKKVSVEGGPIVTLATVGDYPYGLSWGPRGMLVAGRAFASGGLFAIGERGGAVRILSLWKDGSTNRWPVLLPDGNTIAFATFPASGSVGGGRLAVASLTSDRRTILDVHGTAPVAFLNGQLVYATETGTLMAVPFDTRRWVTTGTPIPLIQDVITDPLGGAKAAISASGTLVYRSGKSETQPVLAHGSSITPLIAEPRDFATPRFSPDGKRVAFTVGGASATDVWVFDRTKGTLTRVTSDGVNQRPDWSPDGKRLVFVSDRGGQPAFWSQPADGSGPAELLYRPTEGDPFEGLLSPDGHWLVYRTGPAARSPRSIFAVRLDGDRTPIVLVTNRFYTQMPRLSPDGRWLAYQSNESNSFEIYVRPFPGAGGRVQVSVGGGTEPVWARSGHTLYYRHGQDVIAAAVTTGASFAIGDRRMVLSGDYLPNASHANYDVSPDDSQFLMIRRAGLEPQTIVVHNWVRELMGRVGTQK
jgi:Tol biopolymer transport system component